VTKIAEKLDFNLQLYSDRSALVNFLWETGELDYAPPGELDKVANYLLYAEDVDAASGSDSIDVELREPGGKRKVSYEALIESALGEREATAAEQRKRSSAYRIPRPTISRVDTGSPYDDCAIPGMRDLWAAIDIISERYTYAKNVLDGKCDMDPERELVPTYQRKYFLREWMIDLRREQFLLRDAYRPCVCNNGGAAFGYGAYAIPDVIGVRIGSHVLAPSTGHEVDFANPQHIHALLKFYAGMHYGLCDSNDPHSDWWEVYDFLDELVRRYAASAAASPEHKVILARKVLGFSNEEIVRELENYYNRSYSINYISTIWKRSIAKAISKQAELWYEEYTHQPDGSLCNMMRWKVCPQCGRQLYAHELNFGQRIDGTWRDLCKVCAKKGGKG